MNRESPPFGGVLPLLFELAADRVRDCGLQHRVGDAGIVRGLDLREVLSVQAGDLLALLTVAEFDRTGLAQFHDVRVLAVVGEVLNHEVATDG